MADNYLERQYEEYEARKRRLASGQKGTKGKGASRFYTREGRKEESVAVSRNHGESDPSAS